MAEIRQDERTEILGQGGESYAHVVPTEATMGNWWENLMSYTGVTEKQGRDRAPEDAGAAEHASKIDNTLFTSNGQTMVYWTEAHERELQQQMQALEAREAAEAAAEQQGHGQGLGQGKGKKKGEGEQEGVQTDKLQQALALAEQERAKRLAAHHKNVNEAKGEDATPEEVAAGAEDSKKETLTRDKQTKIVGYDEKGTAIVTEAETDMSASKKKKGPQRGNADTIERAYAGEQSLGQTSVKTDLGLEAGDKIKVKFNDGSVHEGQFTGKFAEGVGPNGAPTKRPVVSFPGSESFAMDAASITANVTKGIEMDLPGLKNKEEENRGTGMRM